MSTRSWKQYEGCYHMSLKSHYFFVNSHITTPYDVSSNMDETCIHLTFKSWCKIPWATKLKPHVRYSSTYNRNTKSRNKPTPNRRSRSRDFSTIKRKSRMEETISPNQHPKNRKYECVTHALIGGIPKEMFPPL